MTVYTASDLGISPGGDVTSAVQAAFDSLQSGDSFVFDGAGRYTISRASAGAQHGVHLDSPVNVSISVSAGAELYTAESIASTPFNMIQIDNPSWVVISGDGAIRGEFTGAPATRVEGRLVFLNGSESDFEDCEVSVKTVRVTHQTNAANAALYGVLAVGNVSSAEAPRGRNFRAHSMKFERGSVGRLVQVRRIDNSIIEEIDFDGIGGELGTIGIRPQGDMAGLVVRRNNIRISADSSVTTEAIQARPGTPAYGPLEAPQITDNVITGSCDAIANPNVGVRFGASTDALVARNLIIANPLSSSGVRAFTVGISDTEPNMDVSNLRIQENYAINCGSSYVVTEAQGGGEYKSIHLNGNVFHSIPPEYSGTDYANNRISSGLNETLVLGEATQLSAIVYEVLDGVVSAVMNKIISVEKVPTLLRKLTHTIESGIVSVYSDGELVSQFEPQLTSGAAYYLWVSERITCTALEEA